MDGSHQYDERPIDELILNEPRHAVHLSGGATLSVSRSDAVDLAMALGAERGWRTVTVDGEKRNVNANAVTQIVPSVLA